MTVDVTQAFTRRRIIRDELIGLFGVVERNLYLTKRYLLWDLAFLLWTVANTLTIVFIARGVGIAPAARNELETKLLVGGVIWAFLGIIFEIVTETVAWERWEGTIEYTFMAPVSRPVHLIGMGVYAVLYGLVRAALVFFAVVVFIGIHLPHANYGAAIALLAIASISFIGVGMMTAVLPLVSPEKGTQLGFVAQGLMLVVSGVYYPVNVLPEWMQWVAKISPGDVRAARQPGADPERRRARVGGRLAAARDRRVLDPDRARRLQGGRAVREAARQAQAVGMKDWFAGRIAERYDGDGETASHAAVSPIVDFLEPFAADGALELGIGTGRIALPLAARGVRVHGIDLSPDMVAQLRNKPGGTDLPIAIGDFATTSVDGRFSLVYLVFNTIMNLTSQDAQVACFRNAAAHLATGGRLRDRGDGPRPAAPAARRDIPSLHGPAGPARHRRVRRRQPGPRLPPLLRSTATASSTISMPFRYAWPSELDLMARARGHASERAVGGLAPRAVHGRVHLARLRLDRRNDRAARRAESDSDLEAWRCGQLGDPAERADVSAAELRGCMTRTDAAGCSRSSTGSSSGSGVADSASTCRRRLPRRACASRASPPRGRNADRCWRCSTTRSPAATRISGHRRSRSRARSHSRSGSASTERQPGRSSRSYAVHGDEPSPTLPTASRSCRSASAGTSCASGLAQSRRKAMPTCRSTGRVASTRSTSGFGRGWIPS